MAYDPQSEVGLIHKWLHGHDDRGDDRGAELGDRIDTGEALDENMRRNRVNYLLANASLDIDANFYPPGPEEIRRASVMEAPQNTVGEPEVGGLRESALENLYSKLDPRGQGYVEGIFLEEDSVLVRLNAREEDLSVDLTPYERGLLSYAMPKITQAITHSGRITHDRILYILRSILFASQPRAAAARTIERRTEVGPVVVKAPEVADLDSEDAASERKPSKQYSKLLFDGGDQPENLTEAGSNLLSLIVRLYSKLDPTGLGFLEDLPSAESAGLTPFEASLLELTRGRLQWEFHRADAEGDGKVGKQIVINMLCEAMEADLVGERRSEKRLTKDGMSRPPLETELRSIHREAARLRQGKKGYDRGGDPAAMCTFKPEITRRKNSATNTRPPRASATARLANTMSTKDREELLELQECTFQPNLHKVVAPKYQNPKYRTHRTNGKPEAKDPADVVKYGAFSLWVDNLRSFNKTTPVDEDNHPSPWARRDASPGKNPRKMDMDMSCGRYRKDANPRTDRGEQDWGRCIRLTEQYFKDQPPQSPAIEEENTRVFAETFLALRASASRGRDLLL